MTIEHVRAHAPKGDYWKLRFTQDEHSLWLHRLGTPALLRGHKNYKAKDYDFDCKKKVYGDRNQKGSFDLTDVTAIRQRGCWRASRRFKRGS